jgi:DNA polymerase-3 subunit delta'
MTAAGPTLDAWGQEAVVRRLEEGLRSGTAQRTLLFSGPEGVGRRRAAAWLCAYLNCLAPEQARPCGACASCVAVAAGRSLDYKEVAPAGTSKSGRAKLRAEISIDQLVPRDQPGADPDPLGPWLAARPHGRYRVGVIDDAHAMNVHAANAFLKTLEEPPAHAFVVLVAPGPEALLPTVASRALNLRFGAVPVADAEMAEARAAAEEVLASVEGDMLHALEGAEDLAKAVSAAHDASAEPGPTGWLRELLRELPPDDYAAALELLDEYEGALAAYANASLASATLALRLRALLRANRAGASVRSLAG